MSAIKRQRLLIIFRDTYSRRPKINVLLARVEFLFFDYDKDV